MVRLFLTLVLALLFAAGCSDQPSPGTSRAGTEKPAFAGTTSCRGCHEKFYQLWSTSWHGLAMQPVTAEFVRKYLTPMEKELQVGPKRYLAVFTDKGGMIRETGPGGQAQYPMVHALGGKNVFFFLTPLDKGRLQTMPLAYDANRRAWYDTAASGMRHFVDVAEMPIDWRDPLYTFNTSCYSCHVSQLENSYDLKKDVYHTTWAEPGINCETCHGPSSEHVKAAKQLKPGSPMPKLGLISTKKFTAAQHNANCSSCHAKASPIAPFDPQTERFFDYFDLVTGESPDYYPDGRDLGENYTYTGWLMNPCAISGKMHCVQCHTSSGRYRFAGNEPNNACLPCHAERVRQSTAHTHHKAGGEGDRCVSCHMPKTEFARMRRSDHSLLPPTPAATMACKSPNACNICHKDKDAAWSDQYVRQWHQKDYQAPVLKRASVLAAARKQDWKQLPEILAAISDPKQNEVYVASLVRLLLPCQDSSKWPVLMQTLKHSSPLVRSAAAAGLLDCPDPKAPLLLLESTRDDSRLVRIRAASALPSLSMERLSENDRKSLETARNELMTSLKSRPDDWASHYNLGNYAMQAGQLDSAAESFQIAHRLRNDEVMPLVNLAMVEARRGNNAGARTNLLQALTIDATNATAHFNLGLLEAELGEMKQAELHLRSALKSSPSMSQASYNLAIILSRDRLKEAIEVLRQGAQHQPVDPRLAYTLGFYLQQSGDLVAAAETLEKLVREHPDMVDGFRLLVSVYERQFDAGSAVRVCRQALGSSSLPESERVYFITRIQALTGGK